MAIYLFENAEILEPFHKDTTNLFVLFFLFIDILFSVHEKYFGKEHQRIRTFLKITP